MCLLVISHPHPLSMGRLEFVCKRSEGPWRISGFHEHMLFYIFMKSPPLLLNYVSVAASISMATPLHHHLKAQWSNTKNRKTTVLGHFSIKTYSHLFTVGGEGVWGGGNLNSLADNLCHRLKFTFLCQIYQQLSDKRGFKM